MLRFSIVFVLTLICEAGGGDAVLVIEGLLVLSHPQPLASVAIIHESIQPVRYLVPSAVDKA